MNPRQMNEAKAELAVAQEQLRLVMADVRSSGAEPRTLSGEESAAFQKALLEFLQAQAMVHALEILDLQERLARLESPRPGSA